MAWEIRKVGMDRSLDLFSHLKPINPCIPHTIGPPELYTHIQKLYIWDMQTDI